MASCVADFTLEFIEDVTRSADERGDDSEAGQADRRNGGEEHEEEEEMHRERDRNEKIDVGTDLPTFEGQGVR